jgi:VWFA-related protein
MLGGRLVARRLVFLLSALWLFAICAWPQAADISSPGTRSDPSLVPITPPPAESSPNSRVVSGVSADDLEGRVQFPVQTILVQVPILVADKSGNHVHGLAKTDFHVFENGKERRIATFEEITATDKQLSVVATKPGEFTNLMLSDQQPRTVAVIALDTVNTPLLDQANGRRELIKYLTENMNSDQVLALMIITSQGVKVVHGLTDDRQQLVQLLKGARGEQTALLGLTPDAQVNASVGDIPALPRDLSRPFAAAAAVVGHGDALSAQVKQEDAIEQTLNGFLEIAWYLSGIPGRKSLVWATGGFPFAISTAAQLPPGVYLAELYERTMQAFDAAQISVYPVDVRGLIGNYTSAEVVASNGPAMATRIRNSTQFQQSLIETFNQVADMTGGKAFYNTNDLAGSFKRAAEDASSYYLVGYYLDTHNNKPGWRELKVKVDKNDLELRAREGFFVTNTTMNFELTRSSDVSYALTSPIEGTGVPLSVRWLGSFGDHPKKKTEFVIHIPPGAVSIENTKGWKHVNFDFAAAAYVSNSKTGKAAVTTQQTFTTAVPDAQMASLLANGIDFKNALELGPGQYVVRVVIRDNVTGKVGSVTAPLTVN